MPMDNRFYRPHYSQSAMPSRFNINNGGIPIHSAQPSVQNHKPEARAATRKVVQIPVRFVDSEPSSRPDSALKIQKVFRGFLIRRGVKKIMQLKREADEIAQMISRSDVVELIRKDQRERLRINEMLMALLFKLDLIRGFDAGVRDCRKAVVKKVISLQDRVDAIVSFKTDQIQSESSVEFEKHEIDEEVLDSTSCNFEELKRKEPDPELCPSGGDFEMEELEEKSAMDESGGICEGDGETDQSEVKSKEDNYETSKDEFEDAVESIEESNVGKETEEIKDMPAMFGEENINLAKENGEVSNMKTPAVSEEENEGEKKDSGAENKMSNNQQVLQKLMEDNQKMMNMMTQLFERNEMQTQMLNTLKNKVELLEKKAFVCLDKTRKKKKRHSS